VQYATAAILALNLVALVALVRVIRALGAREKAVQARVAELGPVAPMGMNLERAFVAGRKRLLVVEILNPLELAAEKHRLAEVAGGLAPAAVRKMVYEVAAKITKEQLEKQGVHATVEIHVAD
jgi:hypothetical protein